MSFRHSVTNRAAEKAALIIYIFGRMVLRLRLTGDMDTIRRLTDSRKTGLLQ